MPVIPPGTSSLIETGVQLFLAIYREVAIAEIIKKANGKYDEGIKVLETYHALMTRDQIEQIAAMRERVEAARPPQHSEPTALRDLIRNPFNKFNTARKFRRICKEYKTLVQRMSQSARAEKYLVFTSREENGSPSRTFRPVVRASHADGVRILVTQEVAHEIERAAGPGAEMTTEFCGLKISVGASTSMKLQFTSSGSVTVALGLIQDPSLAQREDEPALVLAASGESAQAEEGANTPRHTSPQHDASGRIPSSISLSGTATIFPRQKNRGDLNRGDGNKKKADAPTKVDANNEGTGGRVAYALRLDNLAFHDEVDATPTIRE